jgi:hypothetical protein
MTGPPATRPIAQTTAWGVEKQAHVSEAARRVRVVGLDNRLLDICTEERIQRYLNAPNTEIIRSHGGTIVAIKLLSAGDDSGHLGEQHGNSNQTTRMERGENEHRWFNGRNVRSGIRHPYNPSARTLR